MSGSVKKHAGKSFHLSEDAETPKAKQQTRNIRLEDFIREQTAAIVDDWEKFARSLNPASNHMTPLALRDHIHEILLFIVDDIGSPQTSHQQEKKAQGEKKKPPNPTAAETHAALRLAGGFNIEQMVSEWRALRASIIRLWSKANVPMNEMDIVDIIRFNESIDQGLAESVSHYTQKVNYSKDLLMGILSHDLRTPLSVITISAQLMLKLGGLNERQKMLTSQIFESTSRVTTIVNDLLDVTRARFGSGLPMMRSTMDMGYISRQLVAEMQAAYPKRTITLEVSGDVKGSWDKARIGQVFSNLIGNALQYSFQDSAIDVTVKGNAKAVIVSVHNMGMPVPPEKTLTIFDSLTRGSPGNGEHPKIINLGLGLYIAKDIVVSHGGTIDVISTEEEGTTFTAKFPKTA